MRRLNYATIAIICGAFVWGMVLSIFKKNDEKFNSNAIPSQQQITVGENQLSILFFRDKATGNLTNYVPILNREAAYPKALSKLKETNENPPNHDSPTVFPNGLMKGRGSEYQAKLGEIVLYSELDDTFTVIGGIVPNGTDDTNLDLVKNSISKYFIPNHQLHSTRGNRSASTALE